MTWTSNNPHLSGNFAPVWDERDDAELAVVEGAIPERLEGAYFRNGPNPLFEPTSYTYPYDGDGMVHGVYLSGGKARYRNRFVETRGLRAERREGRTLYGGIADPRLPAPELLRPEDDPGPVKNGAFIHVIAHAGRLLALYEAASCYEMTWTLETLGEWRAGGDEPIVLGAHTRRHPADGARYGIAYGIVEAAVTVQRISAAGRLEESRRIPLAAPTMLHDLVVTERHAVLLCTPAIFDVTGPARGEGMLQWRPELGTRIAVVPLDGGAVRWLETEPFFVFHFANGFEAKGRLVLDYVRHQRLNLGVPGPGEHEPPHLHRMAIDLATGRLEDRRLSDLPGEFPRANERRECLETRCTYLTTLTRPPDGPAGSFNAIARIDAEGGGTVLHDFGAGLVGEAAFVPDPQGDGETAGWLALFVYEPSSRTSDFVLLDARQPDAPPTARLRLPRRVPHGVHGSWVERASVSSG